MGNENITHYFFWGGKHNLVCKKSFRKTSFAGLSSIFIPKVAVQIPYKTIIMVYTNPHVFSNLLVDVIKCKIYYFLKEIVCV